MGFMANMIGDLIKKVQGQAGGDGTPVKYTYNPDTQTYTQMAKGGKVMSASKRADGIAQRGKTKGTMVMCGGGYAKGKK